KHVRDPARPRCREPVQNLAGRLLLAQTGALSDARRTERAPVLDPDRRDSAVGFERVRVAPAVEAEQARAVAKQRAAQLGGQRALDGELLEAMLAREVFGPEALGQVGLRCG